MVGCGVAAAVVPVCGARCGCSWNYVNNYWCACPCVGDGCGFAGALLGPEATLRGVVWSCGCGV